MTSKKKAVKLLRKIYRQKKRHEKNVKRKGKIQSNNSVHHKELRFFLNNDNKIIEKEKASVFDLFAHYITPGSGEVIVRFPKEFSFCTNYSSCMKSIKQFASSMYDFIGKKITLDFSDCVKADTAALFVLQIFRLELTERLKQLGAKLKYMKVNPNIELIPPNSRDVLRLLLICAYPVSEQDLIDSENDSTLNPIHFLGYFKGSRSQKHYLENKKSVFTASVVTYLNHCLNQHGYKLIPEEINSLDGIIAEILNNAEDHSGTNDWFITANFSKEISKRGSVEVGEMNLTILNFGNSIYEAFKETKDRNLEMYQEVERYAQQILNSQKLSTFNEEQLFTLATMQDQVSRLKYERQSRGTGTMKFINSFLELGDYENKKKGFVPNLSIFSGNVHLTCDNTYKPFLKDNVYCLSLNSQNDLSVEPCNTHLKRLSEKFTGTLLSVKIYLNKDHLDRKYGSGHETEN